MKGVMPVSQNVTFRVQGTKLVIEVDLSREVGQSASGKSIIIATRRAMCWYLDGKRSKSG
jgi:hypothetical protein